jgi:flagellar protein FliO/FliZ
MAYFIILFTGEPLQGADTTNSVLELLGIILIFCCVLYLAYVASRFVGKKFSTTGKAKHIQVVEQIGIGLDRQLLLIRAGTDHYLFVSSKKELKMVAKVAINDDNVDMEVATQSEEASGRNFDFRQIFDKYLNTAPKQMKKMKKHIDLSDKDKPLKENISRLQHMQKRSYEGKEVQNTCQEKEES